MSMIQDHLRALLNVFVQKKMVQDGEVPAPSQLQTYINTIKSRLGRPLMRPSVVTKNMESDPKSYNKMWGEAKFDLDFLFSQAKKGAVSVIRAFQYNHTQLAGLIRQVHIHRRDINTLLLVHDRTTGMLDNIHEDFNDLSRIDTVETTAEVDTAFRVVRMGSTGSGSKLYFGDAFDVGVDMVVAETFEGTGVSLISFEAMEGSSNQKSIMNDMVNDFWGAVVTKDTDAPIEWRTEIKLPEEKNLGRIQFDGRGKNKFNVGMTTVNDDGEEFYHGNKVVLERGEWRFAARPVRRVIFTIKTRDFDRDGDDFKFYLIVVNVSMFLDSVTAVSDLYTNTIPLEFNNEVGRVSMVTSHEGDIDWFMDVGYKSKDTNGNDMREESGWLPIVPLEQNDIGDPVVLGSLTRVKPQNIAMHSDIINTISENINGAKVSNKSLKVTTGVDLWRVDYHDVSLVNGRYLTAPYAVDMDIAHNSFLSAADMPIDIDPNIQTSGIMHLEMFHRFRFSSILYIDPAQFEQKTYDIRVRLSTNSHATITRNDTADPILEFHTVDVTANRVTGITTVQVTLTKNWINGIGWEYVGRVEPKAGVNYVVLYVDTGVEAPSFTPNIHEAMKNMKMSLSIAVNDIQNTTITWEQVQSLLENDADFMMAGAETAADVRLFRDIIPHSKLSNKIAVDYDRASVDSTERSDGSFSAFVYLNHPYLRFELNRPLGGDPRRPESTLPMDTTCRVEYSRVDRLVQDVRVWAHMKKGNALPTIDSFTLKFAL